MNGMNYFINIVAIYSYFTNNLFFGRLNREDSNYGAIESYRNTERSKRVANGEKVEQHSKPWMVFLTKQNRQCGGFLIDPHLYVSSTLLPPKGTSDIVVTAAHCATIRNHSIATAVDPSVVRAYFDVNNRYVSDPLVLNVTAKDIIVHEDYMRLKNGHDIAIIRLSQPVNFSPHVKPLNITSFDSTKVSHCSVSGWGVEPGIERRVLATAYFQDFGNISESHATVTVRVKDDARVIQGDSGSPILCHKDGQAFAQGVVSHGPAKKPLIKYADIFQTRSWILSAMEEIYMPTMSHVALYNYIRFGASNRNLISIKLNDFLRNFYGYIPTGVQVELDDKFIDYRRAWMDNRLEEWVLLDHNAFNPIDLVGYSEEKDVYNCVSSCFIRNSLGGCNYVPVLKRCYFLSSRQPCGTSGKCIQFGDYETVHIYYHETLRDSRPTIIGRASEFAILSNFPSVEKTSQHVRYKVYLSYKHEEGYICPAVLHNYHENDTIYDIATVNKKCLQDLIYPRGIEMFDLNHTLNVNIVSMFGKVKRIAVSIDPYTTWVMTYADESETHLTILKLSEKIRFRNNIDDSVNDRKIWMVDAPVPVYFNPYMGGYEVGAFTTPWMVLLQSQSGKFCQGVFVNDSLLEQSTPNKYYILTSVHCLHKIQGSMIKVRFGVHLFTMESFYEQSVEILQEHVHRHMLALLVVQNSFLLKKQIRPISLAQSFGIESGSNLFAHGWNFECPHRKVLHKIPMSWVKLTSKTRARVTPKEQYATECNGEVVNTGRPIVQCTSGNENCKLYGISTNANVEGGKSLENVAVVWSLISWLRKSMKSNDASSYTMS